MRQADDRRCARAVRARRGVQPSFAPVADREGHAQLPTMSAGRRGSMSSHGTGRTRALASSEGLPEARHDALPGSEVGPDASTQVVRRVALGEAEDRAEVGPEAGPEIVAMAGPEQAWRGTGDEPAIGPARGRREEEEDATAR